MVFWPLGKKQELPVVLLGKLLERITDVCVISQNDRAWTQSAGDGQVLAIFVLGRMIAIVDEEIDIAKLFQGLNGIAIQDLAHIVVGFREEKPSTRIDVGPQISPLISLSFVAEQRRAKDQCAMAPIYTGFNNKSGLQNPGERIPANPSPKVTGGIAAVLHFTRGSPGQHVPLQ